MRAIFVVLATLSFAAPALADGVAPQPQQDSAEAQPMRHDDAGKKIICHQQVHEGELTPIKLCGTQQSWARARMETMQTLNEIEIRSYSGGNRR
ncbi:MAG TPA: hypothetical protein VG843_05185 [Rhizomicrobium sp.]|jgi:hypothetical protein|nr:hypothetical protein [Rhizomicrobium sp.]